MFFPQVPDMEKQCYEKQHQAVDIPGMQRAQGIAREPTKRGGPIGGVVGPMALFSTFF